MNLTHWRCFTQHLQARYLAALWQFFFIPLSYSQLQCEPAHAAATICSASCVVVQDSDSNFLSYADLKAFYSNNLTHIK